LKPKAPPSGNVDGAWWPWSDDLTTELADLLAVLSVRLGPIHHVRYHLDDWVKAPAELVVDGQAVRLDGDREAQMNTVDVLGGEEGRIVLLVIPSNTDAVRAHTAMMTAAGRGDDSTVDQLLTTPQ
jgi:hypothetical protein